MSDEQKRNGLASLYSAAELRKFISNYLILLGVTEGLIFFFCWVHYLATRQIEFPWKAYLIAAFLTPVAISFLLGLTVYGFNRYLYGRELSHEAGAERSPTINRFDEAVRSLQQVPFLVTLLLLVLGGGGIYKLDAIVAYLSRAGERALEYLLWGLAAGAGVTTVVALVWMVLSYRLRCRRLAYLQQYRTQVLERTGLILLEDETVIDRDGKVVERQPGLIEAVPRSDELTLLPRLGRKK